MTNVNELIEKITDFLQSEAKTETIIGEQFKLGEYTCVPLISIGIGFGGGGKSMGETKGKGEDEGTGAGGAAGMGMAPVGFLVSKGSDIQFIPTSTSKGLSAAFEKLPDLLEKFLEKNKAAAAT